VYSQSSKAFNNYNKLHNYDVRDFVYCYIITHDVKCFINIEHNRKRLTSAPGDGECDLFKGVVWMWWFKGSSMLLCILVGVLVHTGYVYISLRAKYLCTLALRGRTGYSDEIFYSPNEILIAQIDCFTVYPKKFNWPVVLIIIHF